MSHYGAAGEAGALGARGPGPGPGPEQGSGPEPETAIRARRYPEISTSPKPGTTSLETRRCTTSPVAWGPRPGARARARPGAGAGASLSGPKVPRDTDGTRTEYSQPCDARVVKANEEI